jgi:hypothetical protein
MAAWLQGCKEYKNILLDYHQSIIVFKYHKNITFNGFKPLDPVLRWLLVLEVYGVTFEYLPGNIKKNVAVVADALSCLDIDSLKIQEETEKALTLLSESENIITSNVKLSILMYTALIFKEQAKVNQLGSREKGLAQSHYSIQHIEEYDLLYYKGNQPDLHFSIIETEDIEYCLANMNIHFIRDRL